MSLYGLSLPRPPGTRSFQTRNHQADANIDINPKVRCTATGFSPNEEAADSEPGLAVGFARVVELGRLNVLATLVVLDEPAAPPVPVVPPVFPGATALLTPHAPVKVDMTLIFCNAAGVEPQFVACVIQIRLLSRSKTTIPPGQDTKRRDIVKSTYHRQTA